MILSFTSNRQAELLAMLGLPVPSAYPASARDEAMPAWLVPQLLFSEHAETRLRRWAAAGQPDVPATDVEVLGDDFLVSAVERVIGHLPPPVRWHLAFHATIRVAGHGSGGHSTHRSLPRAGAAEWPRDLTVVWRHAYPRCPLRRWRIGQRVLSGLGFGWLPPPDDPMMAFESCVAHEAGHAWLGRAYPVELLAEPVSAEARHQADEDHSSLFRLATEWNLLDHLAEGPAREERRVAALAARWGFSGAAVDCRFQAMAARQRVWSEARSLAACESASS